MKKDIPAGSISLWRHFFDREETEEQLTESMIQWQERWKWDFMKVNPPACYHVLDWGSRYRFFHDPLREPEQIEPAIRTEGDIDRIGKLDVTAGMLGVQLKVLRNLRQHFGPALPIVETVFSPIEIAHRLLPDRKDLKYWIEQSPRSVHRLLSRITEVFEEFCSAVMAYGGADGIFLATKWASSDWLTWEEYEEFGKFYEQQLLKAIEQWNPLVILHVCGANIYLEKMLDYPVDTVSYDFFAKGVPEPSIPVKVLGGIDPVLLKKDPEQAIRKATPYKNWPNWIAGPSCVIAPDTPEENIQRLREALL